MDLVELVLVVFFCEFATIVALFEGVDLGVSLVIDGAKGCVLEEAGVAGVVVGLFFLEGLDFGVSFFVEGESAGDVGVVDADELLLVLVVGLDVAELVVGCGLGFFSALLFIEAGVGYSYFFASACFGSCVFGGVGGGCVFSPTLLCGGVGVAKYLVDGCS